MLHGKICWNLTAVFAIHVLRLVLGLLFVRVLLPLFFTITPFMIEVTDCVVVLALVWFAVGKYGGKFESLGLSWRHLPANIGMGMAVGVVLLVVSLYSEKLYSTMLLLTPTDHPLVLQAQQAVTWRQLLAPLFLAGVLAPLTEEVLYRLFTFLPMKERWGFWGGAIVSSLIFALMHFNAYWFGEIVVVGVGLAFVYERTGSLISAMVAHSLINSSKLLMVFFGLSFG